MISKEDFNKVWKDSTREEILNQYYYDYIELRKVYSIIKEAGEYCRNDNNFQIVEPYAQSMVKGIQREFLEILDKVGDSNE